MSRAHVLNPSCVSAVSALPATAAPVLGSGARRVPVAAQVALLLGPAVTQLVPPRWAVSRVSRSLWCSTSKTRVPLILLSARAPLTEQRCQLATTWCCQGSHSLSIAESLQGCLRSGPGGSAVARTGFCCRFGLQVPSLTLAWFGIGFVGHWPFCKGGETVLPLSRYLYLHPREHLHLGGVCFSCSARGPAAPRLCLSHQAQRLRLGLPFVHTADSHSHPGGSRDSIRAGGQLCGEQTRSGAQACPSLTQQPFLPQSP